ncbi:rasGAP-activating-like protein 1 [Sinocyclocheilus grahami]|uniref:rasGAP-activating-like protein 1 n=1 Tax=Sinocyclocheilus grahami TaxID=75366 RepID=UPI0007AD10EB|nr:PREDICTED: rasGAP-activating-like protein 1 [Sinocyclocheilus grahami]
MARNTSLYFRIVEGRNLPAKDVSGTSDPYCIIKVDNEVVARTATVWRNLNPFWGEEYTLHLPMGFHTLTFYVMDEDTIGHDDVIGKISLSKDVIAAQHKGLDNWLNLTRVDPDEEVQGEIHLALELHRDAQRTSLHCHVIEARDLAPRDISGTSDPFTRIIYNNLSAETSIIKKTRFPHWDETLELSLDEGDDDEGGRVTVEVWDWDMVGKNDFLGKVSRQGKLGALRLKVRLAEERILPSVYYQPLIELLVEAVISPSEVDEPTPLTLLEEVTTVESRQIVAMTLVKIYLGQGLVVPFLDYLNTREVHNTTDPNTLFRSNSLASKAMEQFMKAVGMLYLHEVLKPIINRIFEERKYVELDPCKIDLSRSSLGYLYLLFPMDDTRSKIYAQMIISGRADPNTLFRSNSLASKAMEQFMKAVGMLYLHEVLKPIINRIFEERKYVELDPCKIDLSRSRKYVELDPCKIDLSRSRRISFKGSASEAEVRESSVGLLQTYLSSIMEAIVSSVSQCPPVMRVVFKQLHKRVEEQFPEAENEDVKYLAISGFFFLRLFAPAILTPKLFQLRDHHADTRTSRTLLLLAKALQSVGNLGLQLGHGKEQWMTPLHPIILCSVASVKDFLDKLIDIDHSNVSEAPQRAVFLPSVIVKEGFLQKHKAEGPQLLKRFAFKKRYFWLSSETLSYAKSPDWQVRSSIPIARVCAVERVDENAFQLQNVMQVITQDTDGQLHTTYLQCKNVNELNQWLSAIRKVSIYNEHMLPSFHPGAHRGNKWTCCLQPDRTALGCSRTHSAVTLGDWSDPLDPDAETQIIYKELLQGRDKLRCVSVFT